MLSGTLRSYSMRKYCFLIGLISYFLLYGWREKYPGKRVRFSWLTKMVIKMIIFPMIRVINSSKLLCHISQKRLLNRYDLYCFVSFNWTKNNYSVIRNYQLEIPPLKNRFQCAKEIFSESLLIQTKFELLLNFSRTFSNKLNSVWC